jgi:hypothetical protein
MGDHGLGGAKAGLCRVKKPKKRLSIAGRLKRRSIAAARRGWKRRLILAARRLKAS